MASFISIKKTRGVEYVYLLENYIQEIDGVKKRRQRVVLSFGALEKLTQKDPNALEKLHEQYDSKGVKYKKNLHNAVDNFLSLEREHSDNEINKYSQMCSVSLNYGIWALKPLWDNVLTLKRHIYYLQTEKSSVKFDANAILSYLTFLKVVDPKSQLKAFNHQTRFLCSPLKDIGLHDLYRALSFAHKFKDEIFIHIHNRICEQFNRSMKMVFYDCTNCYFESPYDDKQLLERKIFNHIKEQMLYDGMSQDQFDEYINTMEFREAFAEKFNESIENGEQLFRMHGLSKEHRYDLPLISVALVIDERGIPIDFEIFAGNTSEYKTMPVIIKQMKEKYDIKDVVVVADRGLNSLANLLNLAENELGFIVAQKVTALNKSLEQKMLDINEYNTAYITDDGVITNDILLDEDFNDKTDCIQRVINQRNCGLIKYRKLPYEKIGYVTDPDTGKKSKQKLDCEIIFTYSESRKRRDIAQLQNDIIKAQAAVDAQKDMAPVCSSGWRSLVEVKAKAEPGLNGTKDNQYIAKGLKKDLVEKRKRLAGFCAMVYKKPLGLQDDLKDAHILNSYKSLVRIEDCFRIMKSNFSIRPMFVRNKEHISGHVTVCVMALILLRILQIKLEEKNIEISLDEISKALKDANLQAISANGTDGFFLISEFIDDIYSYKNLNNDQDESYLSPFEKFMENRRQNGSFIEQILKAVDLEPLHGSMTANELSKRLKVKKGYALLVGDEVSQYQQRQSL